MAYVFYSLVTAIFAGYKAHKKRAAKKVVAARIYGIITIVAFVTAMTGYV